MGIPPDAYDHEDLKTRTVFEKCLGKVFKIAAVEQIEGTTKLVIKLDVGHAVGERSSAHTIWVEPEYLESANPD